MSALLTLVSWKTIASAATAVGAWFGHRILQRNLRGEMLALINDVVKTVVARVEQQERKRITALMASGKLPPETAKELADTALTLVKRHLGSNYDKARKLLGHAVDIDMDSFLASKIEAAVLGLKLPKV